MTCVQLLKKRFIILRDKRSARIVHLVLFRSYVCKYIEIMITLELRKYVHVMSCVCAVRRVVGQMNYELKYLRRLSTMTRCTATRRIRIEHRNHYITFVRRIQYDNCVYY